LSFIPLIHIIAKRRKNVNALCATGKYPAQNANNLVELTNSVKLNYTILLKNTRGISNILLKKNFRR